MPLYYQLKQIIINSIDDNIYKEDEAIPTERELIENITSVGRPLDKH